MTASVSEPEKGAATCYAWPNLAGERGVSGPLLTVVVRCNLVVRGPDVALMWPQRSRALRRFGVGASRCSGILMQ
jgi:hypothetical protein